MIDLLKLPPDEAERLAYAEGFTGVAELMGRIDQLEVERDLLMRQVEHLTEQVKWLTKRNTDLLEQLYSKGER